MGITSKSLVSDSARQLPFNFFLTRRGSACWSGAVHGSQAKENERRSSGPIFDLTTEAMR